GDARGRLHEDRCGRPARDRVSSVRGKLGGALVLALGFAAFCASSAAANYVYWPNLGGTTVGRVALDGSQVNNSFVLGASTGTMNDNPSGVATDAQHIYWTHATGIGRSNLDGTGVDPNFIPVTLGSGAAVAVTPKFIYWSNAENAIGRANIDG